MFNWHSTHRQVRQSFLSHTQVAHFLAQSKFLVMTMTVVVRLSVVVKLSVAPTPSSLEIEWILYFYLKWFRNDDAVVSLLLQRRAIARHYHSCDVIENFLSITRLSLMLFIFAHDFFICIDFIGYLLVFIPVVPKSKYCDAKDRLQAALDRH